MSDDTDRLTVNKRELASKVLKCSVPTVDALLERYGDRFPVLERGSNGIEWQFDAAAVAEFLKDAREAEAKAAEDRNQLFQQFTLPIDDLAPAEAMGLTPSQRAALARARLTEHKLAIESGFLVPTAELRPRVNQAYANLAIFFDALPAQLARDCGLPEEVQSRLRALLADARRAFVRDMEKAMKSPALAAEDPRLLHAAG